MKFRFYGNSQLVSLLEKMTANNKAAKTVLFFGEKGTGRKTLAEYYCSLLMCENPIESKPCGECKACKNIANHVHPDIIYAETSGKLGGYSVDTAKRICSDAFIKPNNGDKKIYIFADCHSMDVRTQNTLLKIIEEPPEHVFFIFTSNSKNDFLPTIISRCSSFGVSDCSEEECRTALAEKGYTSEQIDSAVKSFHGNIGMCISFIEDEKLRNSVELTKTLVNSIISNDEYNLCAALYSLGKERNSIREALAMLDRQIRDCAVILSGKKDNIGCYPEGAYRLADVLTASQSIKIHNAINSAWHAVETNANTAVILSALCAEIASVCCA
ncbi:MAG: DNA polymerase III subunit delta' [Ruminococcus sp.]|nr:DNA polymerase III subunit delta' [Ruminococcus sp.]